MGLSLHVVGFMPPDAQWEKMKAVWEACHTAGISMPPEVNEFFSDCDPRNSPGREVDLINKGCVCEHEDGAGYDVLVSKLPKNVSVVRVYMS